MSIHSLLRHTILRSEANVLLPANSDGLQSQLIGCKKNGHFSIEKHWIIIEDLLSRQEEQFDAGN